jgi:RNA polymerase subunit RPABC4/transcription elongation factor Spt4
VKTDGAGLFCAYLTKPLKNVCAIFRYSNFENKWYNLIIEGEQVFAKNNEK